MALVNTYDKLIYYGRLAWLKGITRSLHRWAIEALIMACVLQWKLKCHGDEVNSGMSAEDVQGRAACKFRRIIWTGTTLHIRLELGS